MRKLIIILLLFCSIKLSGQNSLSISLQPCDMGLGVRYDRQVKQTGFYLSASKGRYATNTGVIDNHIKQTIGLTFRNLNLGLSYHSYSGISGQFEDWTFDPISFELGAKTHYNRLFAGIRFDLIKGEGTIDIGFNFKYRKHGN